VKIDSPCRRLPDDHRPRRRRARQLGGRLPRAEEDHRARLHAAQHGAAQAQLQRVVDDAAVKTWSHVALAQAGLARAARARGPMPTLLAAAGDAAGAQALRDQALAASRRYDAPDSPTVTEPLFLGL